MTLELDARDRSMLAGAQASCAVRPERIRIATGAGASEGNANTLTEQVSKRIFAGNNSTYFVERAGQTLKVIVQNTGIERLAEGQDVVLCWSPESTVLIRLARADPEPALPGNGMRLGHASGLQVPDYRSFGCDLSRIAKICSWASTMSRCSASAAATPLPFSIWSTISTWFWWPGIMASPFFRRLSTGPP